jgi:hypothetical protein
MPNLIGILPAALILIFLGWWENYVDKKLPFGQFSLITSSIGYATNPKHVLWTIAHVLGW